MEDRWDTISSALRAGCRTLPGGSSLAKLLAADRGVRNRSEHPRYNEEMILEWCDGFHARHGTWPKATSGAVEDAPGETWAAVVAALSGASRGITRKLSLANLLQERRDVRNVQNQPRLIIDNILQWADAFHARTGRWPTEDSGEIPEAPGETWGRVSNAIYIGTRGLTFGATLARILATQRDHVLYTKKAPHTHEQILAWADEYRARTGKWPNAKSGPVEGAAGENWNAVNTALQMGIRGHPGGDSLARLFQRERRE
jgi:hypothetical protein